MTAFLGHIAAGLQLVGQPEALITIVLAALYGLFIGAIPGLTATMATALLVPVAFFLDPLPAIAAIVTMEAIAIFAGDIPAFLVRVPGTPSSAAYVDDAYGLTVQGRAGLGLGTAIMVSLLGGLFGTAVLMVASPILAEFALQFTPLEYFWLGVLGLTSSVAIAATSPAKNLLALLLGLLLSTVGLDIVFGYPRFTFGSTDLLAGVNFIPAMIGLFGIAEVLRNVAAGELQLSVGEPPRRILRGVGSMVRRHWRGVGRSSVIGTLIGALPGAGADIAAWIAYGVARRTSRQPETFGKGNIEAIANCSAANNAALGGAWVPALVFGIPGDSITAIAIGILLMKGLRPGPDIFTYQADMLYGVYWTFLLANLLLLPLGLLAVRTFGLMLSVPRNILLPAILLFCIVGSFAVNNSLFDVGVMLVMGVLGYLMGLAGIPAAPVVLGIVLGPIVEQNFMMSMIRYRWNLLAFFSRPVAAILGVLSIALWLYPVVRWWLEVRASYREQDRQVPHARVKQPKVRVKER